MRRLRAGGVWSTTTGLAVVCVSDLHIGVKPAGWAFADARRREIDAHFAELRRVRPSLWNGRVLLLSEWMQDADVFRGSAFETDFASFLAWRDWGFPDPLVANFFGMAALQASDGAFLLGEMGAQTANAGHVYFPSGTPEPADVAGARVDLAGSVLRELFEETGIAADEVGAASGWTLVFDGSRIAMMKTLRAREPAAALRERILARLATQTMPELADIRIVRGPQDLTAAVPAFVGAFLRAVWG